MSEEKSRRALVIGAGVAGSCCALRLRQHGWSVTLAEKSEFPRAKVCGCCIGGAGLQTLDRLGLKQLVLQAGAPTHRWCGSLGERLIELPLPSGLAISRESLDTLLLKEVNSAGAEVMIPARAQIEQADSKKVVASIDVGDEMESREYDVVIVASGLNASGSQRLLPWREKPNGPFGISFFAERGALAEGVINMACDDDGYVGMVRLEDGRIDIAAALSTRAGSTQSGRAADRVRGILERSRLPDCKFEDPSVPMTTPPLRRSRLPGRGRVIAIGDAAGYVEPFTGEGMTWGMLSGIEAADLISSSSGQLSELGESWTRRYTSLMRSRRLACRTVTNALRSPLARRAVAVTLGHWPSLATPLIRHLNQT